MLYICLKEFMTECIIRFEYCNTNAPDKSSEVNAIEQLVHYCYHLVTMMKMLLMFLEN